MMRFLAKPFLVGTVVVLALILLVLLATASANTSFFEEYFAMYLQQIYLLEFYFLL